MHLDELIKVKPYEKIVYVIRRQWITYIPTIAMFSIVALIPVAIYFVFNQSAPIVFVDPYFRAMMILLLSVFELSVALFFYSSFLMYYLDMMIITNDRLVQIQQKTLFSRSVSELDLYKIQDTTSDVTGVIATVLGYGRLTIETAGEQENFKFEAVAHVNDVRRDLMQLAEEDRKYHLKAGLKSGLQP